MLAILSALSALACDGAAPASPSLDALYNAAISADVLAFNVTCPTPLVVGQKAPCTAVARLASGLNPMVSFDSSWSSSRPDIVLAEALGVVTGRLRGQAQVSASYRGHQASTTIEVIEGATQQ